jgi:hypothetical protein
MPRAKKAALWTELTLEERRERRRLRRVKQREDNVKRGAKMHAARLKSEANGAKRSLSISNLFLWDARLALLEMAGLVL